MGLAVVHEGVQGKTLQLKMLERGRLSSFTQLCTVLQAQVMVKLFLSHSEFRIQIMQMFMPQSLFTDEHCCIRTVHMSNVTPLLKCLQDYGLY